VRLAIPQLRQRALISEVSGMPPRSLARIDDRPIKSSVRCFAYRFSQECCSEASLCPNETLSIFRVAASRTFPHSSDWPAIPGSELLF